MKKLEEKIIKEAIILPGDILKIDSFLNHQIDVKFMEEIGEEFYNLFKDKNPNKILTIESSGIAIASISAKYFGYPLVVFAKKSVAANMSKDTYSAKERSYTRNIEYDIQVAKQFLNEGDRVLILDDFLAKGEAMFALIDICKQAKAEVVGCGVVVCKVYQEGEKKLKDLGYDVKALARIKKMSDDGNIEFM